MSVSLAAIAKRVAQYSGLGRTGTIDSTASTTDFTDAMIASYAEGVANGTVMYEVRPKLATVRTTNTISFDSTTYEIRESGTGMGNFSVGDVIEVSGSDKNDGLYSLTLVDAGGADVTTAAAAEITDESVSSASTISLRGRGYQGWVVGFDKTSGKVTYSPAGTQFAAGGHPCQGCRGHRAGAHGTLPLHGPCAPGAAHGRRLPGDSGLVCPR